MPQKNTPIMFTLLSSVFMIMLVASLFHLPSQATIGGVKSDFFAQHYQEVPTTMHQSEIDFATISYLPQ